MFGLWFDLGENWFLVVSDDEEAKATDEVVFVSETPAVITDSDDDDIVFVSQVKGDASVATRNATQRLEELNTCDADATVQDLLTSKADSTENSQTSSEQDKDEIYEAIRSIASSLEPKDLHWTNSDAAAAAPSTSRTTAEVHPTPDCFLDPDPFTNPADDLTASGGLDDPWADDQLLSDANGSKSGGRGGKTSASLKRSMSSSFCADVPLKKRPLLHTSASESDLLGGGEPSLVLDYPVECLECLNPRNSTSISRCNQDHPCCSECLQRRAKRLLAQEQKVRRGLLR